MVIVQRDADGKETVRRSFSARLAIVSRLAEHFQLDSWYDMGIRMLAGEAVTDGQYWYRYEPDTYKPKAEGDQCGIGKV